VSHRAQRLGNLDRDDQTLSHYQNQDDLKSDSDHSKTESHFTPFFCRKLCLVVHINLIPSGPTCSEIKLSGAQWPLVESAWVPVEDVIDHMRGAGKEVDRFWVKRFVERNTEKLALRRTVFIEEDRYNVNSNDIKAYCDCCRSQLAAVPSPFISNAHETRVGARKEQHGPRAIVFAQTRPGHIIVPEICDDSQLRRLAAVSAFGDPIPPFFVSSNKTFEKKRLADFKLYEWHDHTTRTAPKTLMTEVLLDDWLKTFFFSWMKPRQQRPQHEGPVVLLLNGHAPHVIPQVLAYPVSQRIIIIQRVAHSLRETLLLDLSVFGIFKLLCKKKTK
jgi:hypothetical protein